MKRTIHPDTIKKNIWLVVLIFFAIYGVFFVTKFIGYVSYHDADAGTINEIDVSYQEPAYTWAGVHGVAIMVQEYTENISFAVTGNSLNEENMLFACLEPKITHEIYATTAEFEEIDWDNLVAGNAADVDNYLGFGGTEFMSAAKTFTKNSTITLGGRTINNIPTVYTYEFNNKDSLTRYNTAILKDELNNIIIYATNIASFSKGFNGKTLNYQLLLPIANGTTPTYNFFADPFDDCPAGLGTIGGYGNVTGNITSNEGGVLLQDVIVMVEGTNATTLADGEYILPVPEGIHNIVAIRENFKTYYGIINITSGNTTVHNIIMEVETEEVGAGVGPGVGSGTGSGIGPGQSDGKDDGPGIGPGIGPYIEKPRDNEGQEFVISIPNINKRIKTGNFLDETITLYSFKETPVQIELSFDGNISEVAKLDKEKVILNPKESQDIKLTFYGIRNLGRYNGSLIISGSLNNNIPISIDVTEKDLLTVQALDMEVDAVDNVINPGKTFSFYLDYFQISYLSPISFAIS